MPSSSSHQISRTSLGGEMLRVQSMPLENQKWAASSSIHWIGSSTSSLPGCR